MACAFVTGTALVQASLAAEIEIVGTGTFKPPGQERMANVPAGLAFSRADLASGTWSFVIRYEDGTADSDPDPFVGRYGRAIRAFQLTIGATTINLPVDRAELVISDGGLGFPERESIRVQTVAPSSAGMMRVSWSQIHQTASRMDLRGAPGLLSSDALPAPSLLAHLPTDHPFDRFLLLRVDAPDGAQPLLYLSSSQLSVLARPVLALGAER